MTRARAVAIAIALVAPSLIAFPALQAQEGPLLSATMDTAAIRLGQPFRLTVSVDHDAGDRVAWPAQSDGLEPFELVSLATDTATTTATAANGRTTSRAFLRLVVWELGEVEVPPIVVPVERIDGTVDTVRTDAIPVTVEGGGIDESGDIRGIKPPLSIPRNWLLLLPWVLLVAAVAGLAWWLYRRLARPAEAAAFPPAPPRPAHHLALDALDRLEKKGLVGRGEIKAFHIELSEIMRRYIHGRWGIDALDMSTEEIMPRLDGADISTDARTRIGALLGQCDLVKFAKSDPGFEQSNQALESARAVVNDTIPVPTEEAA